MKQISALIILFCSLAAVAQQEAHYTQFMYNHQLYNPAFVGSRNTASLTALHRSQWLGFDGAPSSQVISFQTPIMQQRAGAGATISHYKIGFSNNWFASGAYSYNVKLTEDLNLRLGLQATVEYMGLEFDSPDVITVSQSDPSLVDGSFLDKYIANVGAGLFLTYKDIFYFGASSPQIYPNEIGFNKTSIITALAAPHRYFTLGAVVQFSEEIELMPNFLIKWVDNAPVDADINFNLRYLKKVTAGLTYRVGGTRGGESIDLLMLFQANKKLGMGLSVDLTLSEIRTYQSGTVELLVRYDLQDEKGNLENPRFFKRNRG